MKDKWLKDIQDRMNEFEIDEPINLWDNINSHIEKERRTSLFAGYKRTKRALYIAAMFAIIISTIHLILPDNVSDTPIPDISSSESIIAQQTHNTMQEAVSDNSEPAHSHNDIYTYLDMSASEKNDDMLNDVYSMPTEKSGHKDYNNDIEDSTEHAQAIEQSARHPERKNHIYTRTKSRNSRNYGKGLYVSLYTSGLNSANKNSLASSGSEFTSAGTNGAIWEDRAMLGILMMNQGKNINTDIKHRLPVRTGVSVAYDIDDKLSIESGLTYSKLSSDIREGSESHYISSEQTLHYIGIPLRIKYQLASWKRLGLYASGGVLAEKCVSGNTSTRYIIDHQKMDTESEATMDRPVQWSINANVGIQVDITKSIGLYA